MDFSSGQENSLPKQTKALHFSIIFIQSSPNHHISLTHDVRKNYIFSLGMIKGWILVGDETCETFLQFLYNFMTF